MSEWNTTLSKTLMKISSINLQCFHNYSYTNLNDQFKIKESSVNQIFLQHHSWVILMTAGETRFVTK